MRTGLTKRSAVSVATEVRFVGEWTWFKPDEICGICRVALDGCAPNSNYPGDDCPVVWGLCRHCFHLQCIESWIQSQQQNDRAVCPMCRQPWVISDAPAQNPS